MRWPTLVGFAAMLGPLALLSGCQASTASSSGSTFRWRADLQPAVYFPLAEGTAWSYDLVDGNTHERSLLLNRVLSRDGQKAVFFEEPNPMSYEDRADSIVRLPSGTAVLKAPLTAGATWDIPDGAAKILAVDGKTVTPAREYSPCLVVEETTTDRRVVTHYAPEVGPVEVEIYARGPGGEKLIDTALLRSYHKAGTDPL